MYRTCDRWVSAKNSFNKIVADLPKKLVNNDSDLQMLKGIIDESMKGNIDNYSVNTESTIYTVPFYKITIHRRGLGPYKHYDFRYFFNSEKKGPVNLECYNYENGEDGFCIFKKEGKKYSKFRVSFLKENTIGDLTFFDLEGNILSKVAMTDDLITQDVYQVLNGESSLVDSYTEYESKGSQLVKK